MRKGKLNRWLYHDHYFSGSINEFAHKKQATQSTDWSSAFVAGKAVDGNSNTLSCTTTAQNYPYWSVDLGISIYVDHLYITNVHKRNGELLFF